MTDLRAKVKLPGGQWARGTVLDNQGNHGPSRILVDATYPARLVEAADWAFVFRCVFERIGRTRNVTPIVLEARTGDDLAKQVCHFARPHLGSRTVEVLVNLDDRLGVILVGAGRPAGSFTVEQIEPPIEVSHG